MPTSAPRLKQRGRVCGRAGQLLCGNSRLFRFPRASKFIDTNEAIPDTQSCITSTEGRNSHRAGFSPRRIFSSCSLCLVWFESLQMSFKAINCIIVVLTTTNFVSASKFYRNRTSLPHNKLKGNKEKVHQTLQKCYSQSCQLLAGMCGA